MNYLSDVNLRAVLTVLIARGGGYLEISNEELYDAMMGQGGRQDGFEVQEIPGGISLVLRPARDDAGR